MNQDIEKAIRLIDDKIKELEHARQTLIDLFGGSADSQAKTVSTESSTSVVIRRAHVQEPRLSRKKTIINLLKEKGPLGKKDIQTLTGMPRGSVSFSLNDKDVFYSKDHKWHLVGIHGQVGLDKQVNQYPALKQGT